MKRFLLPLLLALSTAVLSAEHEGQRIRMLYAPETMDACTVWAAKGASSQPVWIAAVHCIWDEKHQSKPIQDFKIGDVPASVIGMTSQLVAFNGPNDVKGYDISKYEAFQGEDVVVYGLPYGGPMLILKGIASSVPFQLKSEKTESIIYQLPSAPGQSGSPIFNVLGYVVGVIQGSACEYEGFCPISFGTTRAELYQLVRGGK